MALLEARHIIKRFGGLLALNDLDFQLEDGMIAGLIGPNGAGKTTFFNMITGLYRPSSGRLLFASPRLRSSPMLERATIAAAVMRASTSARPRHSRRRTGSMRAAAFPI